MKLATWHVTVAIVLLNVGPIGNCSAIAGEPRDAPAADADVRQLSVFPNTLFLVDGRASQQLLASGQGSDDFLRDVTSVVQYASENPAIAAVDAGGMVRPVAA